MRGLAEDRAGQREPLPLPARQRHALLADPGVEPQRQVVGEGRLGDLQGLPHVGVGGVAVAERHVLPTLIEKSVASSNAVATVERSEGSVRSRTSWPSMVTRPEVTSRSRGTSAVRVVLPEPVAPTTARVSPGRTSSHEIRQHRPGRTPGNRNPGPLEPQVPARPVEHERAADDRRLGVEHLEDPVGRGDRLLAHGQDEPERGHRPDELQDEGRERHQRAQRQRSPTDRRRPEQQHQREGDARHDLQEGEEPGGQPDLLQRGVLQATTARPSYREKTWPPRPNALMVRIPSADSSTWVARSPWRSWRAREITR